MKVFPKPTSLSNEEKKLIQVEKFRNVQKKSIKKYQDKLKSKKVIKKPKKKSKTYYKDKAWTAFSTYIRTRDCIKTTGRVEFGKCITCGKIFEYKKTQAGHFVGGRGGAILFDELAVNLQCYVCNMILKGNYDAYNLYMLQTYGEKVVIDLIRKKFEIKQYTEQDYIDIAEKYKKKTQELLNSLK